MLTHKQLFDLLNRPETPYVDFKGGEYDLSSPRGVKGKGYLDLVKDILCMSNTPRQESAFIVTGVVNRPGSQNRTVGIKTYIDDNDIQNLLRHWIYPTPSVIYYQRNFRQRQIGILEIPIDRLTGPHYIRADLNTKTRESWRKRVISYSMMNCIFVKARQTAGLSRPTEHIS